MTCGNKFRLKNQQLEDNCKLVFIFNEEENM